MESNRFFAHCLKTSLYEFTTKLIQHNGDHYFVNEVFRSLKETKQVIDSCKQHGLVPEGLFAELQKDKSGDYRLVRILSDF